MTSWPTAGVESPSTAPTRPHWPNSGAFCWVGPSAEHGGPGWATVGSRFDELSRLTFQRVPEAKNGKVRLHIDVQVDDIDGGRAQVEQLSGQWTGQRCDYPAEGVVIVMIDPEGHK